MYNSSDPRRAHFTSAQSPVNLTYTQSPENSQVSVTSAPEGSYVFLMSQPFCPQLPSITSPSNSTTEFGNSRVLQADSGHRRTIADASNSSASVIPGNSFPVSSFSLLKPVPGVSQQTLYNAATMNPSASFTTSQNSYLTPLLPQQNSPQMPTQTQVMPQHFVMQPQQHPQQRPQPPSPQGYAQQGSGATPAATQTLMLIATDPNATAGGSFYLQPASPQMATAAVQSGTTQILSPLQLSSPNPQVGNMQGQVTYVVNSAASPAMVSYSAYPERLVTIQGPAAWQGPAAAVAVHQGPPPVPQPSSQSYVAVAGGGSSGGGGGPVSVHSVVPSFSPPPSVSAGPRHPTASGSYSNVSSSSTSGGGPAAASGSPGGQLPAALGVRSFMARNPVGCCMVRDAPLIPNIPPLALPCPAWGKIPTASTTGSRCGNTAVRLP